MVVYEINRENVKHNIEKVKGRAGVPVWGVIKYDGYGLGLLFMAELLKECGITRFAVSEISDLIKLRNAGYDREDILLIAPPDNTNDIKNVILYNGIFSVGSTRLANSIEMFAGYAGKTARAHVTVDTGMGRFGFICNEYANIRNMYTSFKNIGIEGIYSHFSSAFNDSRTTEKQFTRFCTVIKKLENDGINRGMAHIANSAGLFRYKGMELDAVRVGSAFVGRVCGLQTGSGLKETGYLTAPVVEIKNVPKGYCVGYGDSFKIRHDKEVAIISAGRWHGMPGISTKEMILHDFPTVNIGEETFKMLSAPGESTTIVEAGANVCVGDIARIAINPLKLSLGVAKKVI